MSPDWFDPLGLRGSRLDPFAAFVDAVRGEGPAQQSAELVARAMAQRLVGRRVEVDSAPPVAATVERIDELDPATSFDSMPKTVGEMPMWRRVRGRIADITIGDRTLMSAELDASVVRLVGTTRQRLRIERVGFNATVSTEEITRWATAVSGAHIVRIHEGRLEVTDRRVARWAWAEVTVTAADQRLRVVPVALRLFGREVPRPRRLRHSILRPAEWLPSALVVEAVRVRSDTVEVRGRLDEVDVAIDVAQLLADLGAGGTRSVLRVITGER